MPFTHVTDVEKQQLARWVSEGKRPKEISLLLKRDLSTVVRQVAKLSSKRKSAKVGRPRKITEAMKDRLVTKVKTLTKAADAKFQVTASMIRKSASLKCSDRTILDALHSRGVYMHPLREKPVRTEADETDRLHFGNMYKSRPVSFWRSKVDAYLDNKFFPVYLTGRTRDYAAKRVARGSFRSKGDGLAKGHVKPRKNLKYNTGAPSIHVACAISATRVLMRHEVKGNWNAKAASEMYTQKLGPALRSAYPGRRRFVVLEDNDPSGYKSKLGLAAKSQEHIEGVQFPKRSPDLNPLDYGLWAEINKRLRKQELRFQANKRETRAQYASRLRRTAMSLPSSFLTALVSSMLRRCADLVAASGGDFQE
jgi:hypothetical protein